MLMQRTPYSAAPYGIDTYPGAPRGDMLNYFKEGWSESQPNSSPPYILLIYP
jgi:hypothetical protein